MGGSLGRTEATGYGVVFTLREALKELGIRPENTQASVQGFGNVAHYAIELYQRLGGRVIAVCCWDQADQCAYTYRKRQGIDLSQLLSITDHFGGINKTKAKELGYEVLPGEAWIEQDVDILIPAAMENQITGDNVGASVLACGSLLKARTGQPRQKRMLKFRSAASCSSPTSWRMPVE